MTSPIFQAAVAQWRATRAEFEIVRENAYASAEEACNGVMLNKRGRKAGIDPYSLFIGDYVRAYAYASDELKEWWATHPRLTYEAFEKQTFEWTNQ